MGTVRFSKQSKDNMIHPGRRCYAKVHALAQYVQSDLQSTVFQCCPEM
jgi:hypothetical protein